MPMQPVKVVIAYADKDDSHRERLRVFLHRQVEKGLLTIWDRSEITPGANVSQTIQQQIQQAEIIVLLASADFTAHPKRADEKDLAFARFEQEQCWIIPVLVSAFYYDAQADWGDLTFYPQNRSIESNTAQEALAYTEVTAAIMERVKAIHQSGKRKSNVQSLEFSQLLTSVNYRQQPLEVQESFFLSEVQFAQNNCFAFLIKGQRNFGQDWLYDLLKNRLSKEERFLQSLGDTTILEIPFSFNHLLMDIQKIGMALSHRLQLESASTPSLDDVVQKIFEQAQTQILFLKFFSSDVLPQAQVRQFVESFWHRIAQSPHQPNYPIFMFLIDQDGAMEACPDTFLSYTHQNWSPKFPVRLSEIDEMKESEIDDWLRDKKGILRQFHPQLFVELINAAKRKEKAKDIYQTSEGGNPQKVLERICDECGFDFKKIKQLIKENE
ncbi:MAG: TIR domain-containing protein [Bacteroidota bacterium]